jgi:hypothetical protein
MQTGRCPKCASATVYRRSGGVGELRIHVRTSFLSVPVPVFSYVCTTCGYFEQYIDDATKLAEVAQTWDWVSANP